jgi:hypothetical protein
MVVHTCDPCTLEAEARGLQGQAVLPMETLSKKKNREAREREREREREKERERERALVKQKGTKKELHIRQTSQSLNKRQDLQKTNRNLFWSSSTVTT